MVLCVRKAGKPFDNKRKKILQKIHKESDTICTILFKRTFVRRLQYKYDQKMYSGDNF